MLKELFFHNNFYLTDEALAKFELFLKIFKEKNSFINLSSFKDEKSIIEKHFIDSLMLTKYVDLQWEVADIWTWWWFPLLPLAIYSKYQKNMESWVQYYWIDSVEKKLKAVDDFSSLLWLSNVETIHSRFEDLWQDKNNRESFDYVVSRATAYFPTLLEYAVPLLKVWWIFVAYKMDNLVEIVDWTRSLISLKSEIVYEKKYELAWQVRSLVFVRKKEKTPILYPRSPQIIARKPL